jgi:hypothetical protein
LNLIELIYFFLLTVIKDDLGGWLLPVILTLGRLRKEGYEFDASMGYIVRSCLKTKTSE